MALLIKVIPSDGSGDGSAIIGPFFGELKSIKVTYGGTPDAGTDLTITETGGLQRAVLTLTNKNTSGVFYPRANIHDPLGVAVAGVYEPFNLSSNLTVTLADAVISTADAITLVIEVE